MLTREGSVADLIDNFGGKTRTKHVLNSESESTNSSSKTRSNALSNLPHSNGIDDSKENYHPLTTSPFKPEDGGGVNYAVNVDGDDEGAQSDASTEGADSPGSSAPASPLRFVAAGGYSFFDPPILYARFRCLITTSFFARFILTG